MLPASPKAKALLGDKGYDALVPRGPRRTRRRGLHPLEIKPESRNPLWITIAGIELMHRIREGQFTLGRLRIKDNRAPAVWNAVLAA